MWLDNTCAQFRQYCCVHRCDLLWFENLNAVRYLKNSATVWKNSLRENSHSRIFIFSREDWMVTGPSWSRHYSHVQQASRDYRHCCRLTKERTKNIQDDHDVRWLWSSHFGQVSSNCFGSYVARRVCSMCRLPQYSCGTLLLQRWKTVLQNRLF
jgi:hypothetical protein